MLYLKLTVRVARGARNVRENVPVIHQVRQQEDKPQVHLDKQDMLKFKQM